MIEMKRPGHLPPGPRLQELLTEAVRTHNVLPLTGHCNLACVFCSHNQNPPGVMAFSFGPLSDDILSDLILSLNEKQKIIIGESATRLREGESLSHPGFFAVAEKIRLRYPETKLQVTTNGSLLSAGLVAKLPGLGRLS